MKKTGLNIFIPVWMDREGDAWLNTGQRDPVFGELVVELLNGMARGNFA
jgi:hypothetical protein